MDTRAKQEEIAKVLTRSVRLALNRDGDQWYVATVRRARVLAHRLFIDLFDGDVMPLKYKRELVDDLTESMRQTSRDMDDLKKQAHKIGEMLAHHVIDSVVTAGSPEGWVKRWVTMDDGKVRATHRKVHNEVVPAKERFSVGGVDMRGPGDILAPIDETVNCFPADTQVAGLIDGAYRRHYSGVMVEVVTVEGKHLTGTPNHPVLTTRGWVPLGELQKSDQLVCYDREVEPTGRQDVDRRPLTIVEVFDALTVSAQARRITGGGVDFHGDVSNGDVDVVLPHPALRLNGETSADEFIREFMLPPTGADLRPLIGRGSQDQRLVTVAATTSGVVRRSDLSLPAFGGHPAHADGVGSGATPTLDPVALEERLHRTAGYPEFLSEGILGLPGKVSLDHVSVVSVIENWSGHVFNLSTETGAYVSNDIIVHNCRCYLLFGPTEASLTAASGPPAVIIAALPARDDPIQSISSEQPPHATLVYLHADGIEDAADAMRKVAADFQPFTVSTTGKEPLGDGGAVVLMLEGEMLSAVRQRLLSDDGVKAAHDRVEQFPSFTPHLTLGYPESPPLSDEVPTTIRFDRLAVIDEVVLAEESMEDDMPEPTELLDVYEAVPWYGVLAPEGVPTGDRRQFDADSLTWRDLPLPLRWQKVDAEGHDGSVVVGRIDTIERRDGLIHATGEFSINAEAAEVIGLIAEGAVRGVSVDLDDTEVEYRTLNGEDFTEEHDDLASALAELANSLTAVTKGRVCSAAICAIPAFHEAFVRLGYPPVEDEVEALVASIDEKPWGDYPESAYDVEQWHNACLIHLHDAKATSKGECKLPVRTPSGSLSRAGVHAAASRIGRVDAPPADVAAAKRALVRAYNELGEEPPEALVASADFEHEFASISGQLLTFGPTSNPSTMDGPGWLTHPSESKRLRDYWVHGEGALLIGWGRPGGGDFNRCRSQLGRYVKPQYLAGTCANLHYEALGFWPGQHSLSALGIRTSGLVAAAGPALVSAGKEGLGLGYVVSVATDGARRKAAPQVLSAGDRIKVVGVHAGAYSAQVIEVEPLGNWSVVSLEGEDVRAGAVPATVAVGVEGSGPDVALALDADAVVELDLDAALWSPVSPDSPVMALAHSSSEAITLGAVADVRVDAYVDHTGQYTPTIPTPHDGALVAAAWSLAAATEPTFRPPRSWFNNPQFSEVTPLTITEEGRVYGHMAQWGTCHTGFSECVEPPVTQTDYSYFHLGAVLTDEGEVPCGSITVDTGHAGKWDTAAMALAHYDNTGTVVAYIRSGEDAHGIWFAGAIAARATEEQIETLRGSKLSGDWRPIAGHPRELIACLAVNAPGFPILRPSLAASAGQTVSLLSAGMVEPAPRGHTDADIAEIVHRAMADLREFDAIRAAVITKRRAALSTMKRERN